MRKLITATAVGLAFVFSAVQASAAEFVSDFLGADTTWASNYDDPPEHYFYFLGTSANQSYSATGLDAARSVSLDLTYTPNSLEPVTFTFALNGVDIGAWSTTAVDYNNVPTPEGKTLNFNFGPIAAEAGQAFNLSMRVTNPTCVFCGSVMFSSDSPASLRISDVGGAPVPEPATWAMMILGFGAAGVAVRRRRALAA